MIATWHRIALIAVWLTTGLASSGCIKQAPAEPSHRYGPAPEFVGISGWVNSPPLSVVELRGKVVLIEFWTHQCINCMRVLPYTVQWHRRYKDSGLVVVGVHTPETESEAQPQAVNAAIRKFGIEFPVALDNGFSTWDAYGVLAWPTTYLIDRKGTIIRKHIGEGQYAETEAAIRAALEVRD